MIENRKLLDVQIPPLARSGAICELPIQGFGIYDSYLRVHVVVEAEPR
jgi:hypothetical protein